MQRVFLAAMVLAVAGFTALAAAPAKHLSVPSGWRVPSRAEAAQQWRKRDPNRYLVVRADFNGDGVRDQAKLLLRDKGEGLGLFVFVSQKGGTFKTHLLHEDKDKDVIEAIGIKTAPRGRYETACAKGSIDCGTDEPLAVVLQYPAIEYFQEESASMFFYWDVAREDFQEAWISD